MNEMPARARALLMALIAAAVLVVFGSTVRHGFVDWDDDIHLYDNPRLIPPSAEGLLKFWKAPYQKLYVPLTYTAWAAVAAAARAWKGGAGFDPAFFHAANVLVHAANAILVFLILELLLARAGPPEERRRSLGALAGALLFAVHPLQVEPVAWATGMKDLLAGFLSLLALREHLRGRAVSAFAAFALALLAKPSAVALPFVAAVVDVGLLRRAPRSAARSLAPWFLLAAAWVFVSRWAQPAEPELAGPLWARPFIAGDALWFYLRKLAWPAALAPDYGRMPALQVRSPWLFAAWIPAGALAWAAWRKGGVLACAFGVFAAGLLPVLGLAPFHHQLISTVADRYLYLSMLGPALALAWLVTGPLAPGLAAAGLVALGALSFRQAAFWRDTGTIFERTLEVNPASASALMNLGYGLGKAGDYPRAMALYARLMALRPSGRARNNLGNILFWQGRIDEALAQYRLALDSREPSDVVDAHNNVGLMLSRKGDAAGAASHYAEALRLDPAYEKARNNLGLLLSSQGKTEEAEAQFRAALRAKPNYRDARRNLADLLVGRGAIEEARRELAFGESLPPDSAELDNDLGFAAARQGRRDEAVALYRRALSKRPDYLRPWVNWGEALMSAGDAAGAVAVWSDGVKALPRSAELRHNLGVAYLRLGRRAEAKREFEAALALDPQLEPSRRALAALL